ETLVESREQSLAHGHTAVHGHSHGQNLGVLAERLKDLVPHDFVDELVAPPVSWVERPDIIEFFQGFAVTFLDRIEVAIEIDMDWRHIELQSGCWHLERFQDLT